MTVAEPEPEQVDTSRLRARNPTLTNNRLTYEYS